MQRPCRLSCTPWSAGRNSSVLVRKSVVPWRRPAGPSHRWQHRQPLCLRLGAPALRTPAAWGLARRTLVGPLRALPRRRGRTARGATEPSRSRSPHAAAARRALPRLRWASRAAWEGPRLPVAALPVRREFLPRGLLSMPLPLVVAPQLGVESDGWMGSWATVPPTMRCASFATSLPERRSVWVSLLPCDLRRQPRSGNP